MPLVSIIMPAYRAVPFLDEAIGSILSQTFTDWELIIADDHSQDHTATVAQSWVLKDSRIRLLQNTTRMGAAYTRNRAVAASEGELIAFLDADDIAYPKRVEIQVAYLQSHCRTGLVAHWLDIIDQNSCVHPHQWEWRKEKDTHLPIFLLFGNAVALSSVMMRRSVWQQLAGFPSEAEPCEDYALWSEVAKISPLHIIPQKLGARREYHNSLTYREEEKGKQQLHTIIRQNLSRLHICPSEKELMLHQQLRHRQFELTNVFAQSARQWLEYLLLQNSKHCTYPQKDLQEVVGEIWYDYWHRRHPEGLCILRYYFASFLWKGNSLQKNFLLVALSLVKTLKKLTRFINTTLSDHSNSGMQRQ
ncbi:MAG: glycosyltransferase family A protein [Cytophagales bacterium]|nr:glycosyltransferase family 2 protein [Bernardetiaceae bacterium]MDW8205196.1 glycosyltransferase family A protein [Cytophagales bacterium]